MRLNQCSFITRMNVHFDRYSHYLHITIILEDLFDIPEELLYPVEDDEDFIDAVAALEYEIIHVIEDFHIPKGGDVYSNKEIHNEESTLG